MTRSHHMPLRTLQHSSLALLSLALLTLPGCKEDACKGLDPTVQISFSLEGVTADQVKTVIATAQLGGTTKKHTFTAAEAGLGANGGLFSIAFTEADLESTQTLVLTIEARNAQSQTLGASEPTNIEMTLDGCNFPPALILRATTGQLIDLATTAAGLQIEADWPPGPVAICNLTPGSAASLVVAYPTAPSINSQVEAGRVYVFAGPDLGRKAAGDTRITLQNAKVARIIIGAAAGDKLGSALLCGDVNGDGQTDLVIGAPHAASGSGEVYVLDPSAGPPLDLAQANAPVTIVSPTDDAAEFGSSLALLGRWRTDGRGLLAIGAPGAMDSRGAVQTQSLDDRRGRFTIGAKQAATLPKASAVAMSDDLFVLGTPDANNGKGEVVFARFNGTAWSTPESLAPPSGLGPTAHFGSSVAVSGANLIAVGAPGDSKAVAYVWNGSSWLAQELPGNSTFGSAVAIMDPILVVGAPEPNGGKAFVYRLAGSTWTSEVQLVAGAPTNGFGAAVAVFASSASAWDAIVGAPDETVGSSSKAGAAYVFAHDATSTPKRLPGPAQKDASFGQSVVFSDQQVLVGAPGTTVGTQANAGAVYIFDRNNSWAQTRVEAPKPTTEARFGATLAATNDSLVIGTNTTQLGKAYLLRKDIAGVWQHGSQLVADSSAPSDRFGKNVALNTGGWFVIASEKQSYLLDELQSLRFFGSAKARLGTQLAAGPVTGQTEDDLLATAPGQPCPASVSTCGAVFIVASQGAPQAAGLTLGAVEGAVDATILGSKGDFASALTVAPLNASTGADVLVTDASKGRFLMVPGGPSVSGDVPLQDRAVVFESGHFIASLVPLLRGADRADLLVGAPDCEGVGCVYLLHGRAYGAKEVVAIADSPDVALVVKGSKQGAQLGQHMAVGNLQLGADLVLTEPGTNLVHVIFRSAE